MAFGFIKKLVEKITGKKPAAQKKKDGRSQQKQGGDAKGKSGNGRGRHGRRGRHGNGGEQQQSQGQDAYQNDLFHIAFLSDTII